MHLYIFPRVCRWPGCEEIVFVVKFNTSALKVGNIESLAGELLI